jgi:hypothetical protein
MEFVWLFAVSVSLTKAEARELLKTCEKNIFQADLSDDLTWALVKLMDDGKSGTGELLKRRREWGCTSALLLEKVGILAGTRRALNCT